MNNLTGQILSLLLKNHQFESHKSHGHQKLIWLTSGYRKIDRGACKLTRRPTIIYIASSPSPSVYYGTYDLLLPGTSPKNSSKIEEFMAARGRGL
jgi:hypothetical protein